MGSIFNKFNKWLKDAFEKKSDILVFSTLFMFFLASALKITLFNHILVPGADKWMLQFKLLTTLPIVFIIYPFLFRLKSRAVFVTFYVLQTVYILMAMSYFLYFDNYLHIEQFISNFYEGFIAVMNASAPKNPLLLVAFIDLPLAVYIAIVYSRANRLRIKLSIPVNIVVILSLLVTAYSQYGHYKSGDFIIQIARSKRIGESRIVQRYGTLVNEAVSIYNRKDINGYIESLKYGREQVNAKQAENKADIFIIQVESLESAIVQQKHEGEYVMPYLHSLTGSAVYYPYMLSYHFGGGTSDCEFSVINSVEPLLDYPSIKLTSYTNPNSFVKQLNEAAYEGYAFHGNIGRYYNRDMAFHSFGFKEFFDIAKMKMKDVGWGAPDDEVFDFSLKTVGQSQGPVLSYVITMTSHGPFTNASFYYNNSLFDSISDKKVKDYFNSMAYVDESIKDYVQAIRERYDNAYIFIFGDHTPQIKTGIFSDASIIQNNRTYEFVPLFIITPDDMKYYEEENAASFLDIAPTVLNASGVPFAIKSDGSNLLEPGKNQFKIPHRGLEIDRAELYRSISAALGR